MEAPAPSAAGSMALPGNPFLTEWKTPFGIAPFHGIEPVHFRPAFDRAFSDQRAEVGAIASDAAAPSFENTIAQLERSGLGLRRVSAVFFNLTGAHTNDALQEIEREITPRLARHRNEILMNETLFRRVDELFRNADTLDLTPEQRRVLERYHTAFVRAGAPLAPEAKRRIAEIVERLAALGTSFSQNLLADEKSFALTLETEADRAGLPDFLLAAAARAAEDRGLPGKHVITLSRSSIEPFLQFSPRRDLREQAFRAWTMRGENGGATDNRGIAAEMLALRAERARLTGYPSYAHFRLDNTMAKKPEAVRALLDQVWSAARARAERERDALQAMVRAEGGAFALAPWDWRYFAEKVRRREYEIAEAEIKPYFELDRIIEAAFNTAERLFGLSFERRDDVPVYHPDVRVWEVRDAQGRHLGLFLGDYFARPSKRSGAWMSSFRGQEKLRGEIRPIIVNVMNFSQGSAGGATLLSFDDARTLFHEFGHGLHGLLSDVTFPFISGTSVDRDFVEFPSQLYEHWLERPEILGRFAVHCETGKPMPETLMQRLLEARNFNQGFATVEYLASAVVDLDLHLTEPGPDFDAVEFERSVLRRIGMPGEIVMRHRTPQFGHIFSGDGYAAGYYSYLWSEVLDADGFGAFEEAGDVFDPETARRLRDFVYAAGNSRDPMEAYQAFRGRPPRVEALLDKRGLAPAAEA